MIWVMLALGFVIWYVYFSFDLFINSGYWGYPYPTWTAPFYHAFWQFVHLLPIIGPKERLNWADGNQEWADKLFLPYHFLFTHIMLPFLPACIYLLVA